MNKSEIKGCPWCGSKPKTTSLSRDCWQTYCANLECEAEISMMGITSDQSMRIWNERAGDRQPEVAPNAGNIAGSVSANGSVDTWKLHILGPDDLIPMESELHALREANMLNIGLARVRQKRPNDPNMPWCMAVVERNGVEYTSDQYPLNDPAQRSGWAKGQNAPE